MGSQKQEYEWEPTKGSPSFRMSMAYLAPKYTKNLKCKQVWPTINFYCQVIESACKETDRYKGGTLPSHDSGGWWKDYFSLVGLGGMVPWLHHDLCVFVASLSHLIDTCLQLGLFSEPPVISDAKTQFTAKGVSQPWSLLFHDAVVQIDPSQSCRYRMMVEKSHQVVDHDFTCH